MAIGLNEIKKAAATLQEYKQGKAHLENKIIENEQWFKMRHWQHYRREDGGKLPSSGWLFNSILNKHADAMDNYPEPIILPREPSDQQTAKILSQIIPVVLEQNSYEATYSDAWWYKLKHGTAVKGIFWDAAADDIAIKRIDLLNLFWEPGITDIQESLNIFHVQLIDREILEAEYKDLKLQGIGDSVNVSRYIHEESIDTSKKVAVVDWYYKKTNSKGNLVLHFCKYVNDTLLFASENEERYRDSGFYNHGLYPFVFDVLYPEEGMPVGFGLIDAMKDAQESIDELDSNIQFNARLLSKPRYLSKAGSGVNLQELADYTRDFIEVSGDPSTAIFRLPVESLDASITSYRNMKIEELKEISGNRDFNQGSVTSGVTAASAIAQLQEAGNKLSRDAIKSAYRAFCKEIVLVIELIRQFYEDEHIYRITQPDGKMDFITFNNESMQEVDRGKIMGVELGVKKPIYDIKISGQKKSPFNQIAHNQFIMELYNAGMLRPDVAETTLAAVKLMDFEGKDKLLQTLDEMIQAKQAAMQLQPQTAMIPQSGSTTTMGSGEEAQGMLGEGIEAIAK